MKLCADAVSLPLSVIAAQNQTRPSKKFIHMGLKTSKNQ